MNSQKLKGLQPVQVHDPKIKECRLMYRFGAWVTHCRICAESDGEALHDAREAFDMADTLRRWPYEVALFCGNRRVGTFKEAQPGLYKEII